MQAKDLLECRSKIIDAFKDGNFKSGYLKELDAPAYDCVFEECVNNSIKEIKLMEEKINLRLFKEFFEYSPAYYAKRLINTKKANEN